MSVYMQYAPFKLKNADWDASAAIWAKPWSKHWLSTRRICRPWWKTARSSRPKTLKTTYGLTGGHIFHGELALDQFFTMRPLLDWARYHTPIRTYIYAAPVHIPAQV